MLDDSLQLLNVLPEPSIVLAQDGVILRVNPAACRLFNKDPGDLLGESLFRFSTGDHQKVRDYLQVCLRNLNFIPGAIPIMLDGESQTIRCDGIAITFGRPASTLILLRLKPQQAAISQFSVLNQKITELTQEIRRRVLAEQALRQSETLFREMSDAMPQIVWAARPDGTLDYYNRRWYELTGTQESSIGDQSWLPILHPDDRQRCLDIWYRSVGTGTAYQIEYRFKFPHESRYRWHLGRALPARDASGRIIRWFGTCTDIDDQKLFSEKLEQAVAERTASLSEALAQMEEFSYSISHDLRAPIRAMQGFAQILLSDHGASLNQEGREHVERIIRAGVRMDRLILDVLTFSQLTRAEMELRPVPLLPLISDIVQQFPTLQFPHADIQIQPLPSVIGHEASLAQVISNLLRNAVKFVAPDVRPTVRVRAERIDSRVRVWFEDNGIGILPEHHKRIFGLFERIYPSQQSEGTGVGLAIVRRALERMGGNAGVQSDGDHGSQFWIELPATPTSSA